MTKFVDHAEGVAFEGLTMTLFLADKAAAISLIAMRRGWLNGYVESDFSALTGICHVSDSP